MIRKVKIRFDLNPRCSGRRIVRELNISRERMQYLLKNKLGQNPLKFRKVQQLTDELKKFDWKEPRGYFTCMKMDS